MHEAKWISVKDRLPKPHEYVLVRAVGIDRPVIAARLAYRPVWYQDTEFASADSGHYGNGATIDHDELEVTHWMEPGDLPVLPEGA